MSDRQITRAAVEMAVAAFVWVFASGWYLDHYWHVSDQVQALIEIGGGIAIGSSIGWWRLIRPGQPQGPEPEPERQTRIGPERAGLLLSVGLGIFMSVALLVQAGNDD